MLQNTAGTQELLAVDSLGNTQIKGNLYAPNIVQTSVLAGYVKLGDFLSNLSDYFYKDTTATDTMLEIGKFHVVAGNGFLSIRQLFDFSLYPTDAYQEICAFKLNNAGLGELQLNGVNVAIVGASYTVAEMTTLLAAKASNIDLAAVYSSGNRRAATREGSSTLKWE